MIKILLTTTIALSVFSLHAQELITKPKKLSNPHAIGFRVGLTTPTYLGGYDVFPTKSFTTGFVGGLIYSYYFSDILSIQPELLFIQGGWSSVTEFNNPTVKSSTTIHYGYVQIPVLIKARFGNEIFKFTIHAGPYVGIQTGGTNNFKTEDQGVTTSGKFDIKVEKYFLAPLDFGAAVGIGTNILFGPGVIMIDLRANIGLTDVSHIYPVPSGYKPKTNFIPSISVGYLFQLGSN